MSHFLEVELPKLLAWLGAERVPICLSHFSNDQVETIKKSFIPTTILDKAHDIIRETGIP